MIQSDFPTRQPAPKIGSNGNWWVWDAQTQAYLDTGRPSRGETGEIGPEGQQGPKGEGAFSTEAVALLGTILRAAMYTSNQSGNITALLTELSSGDTPSPEPEPEPEEDVTLSDGVLTIITTSATVSLSGGVLSFE